MDLDAFFQCDTSDILMCVCYVRVIGCAYMSSTHVKIRLLIDIIKNVNVQGLGAFFDVFCVPILVGSCSEKLGVS